MPILNARQKVDIEGYIKTALYNLEKDLQGKTRAHGEMISGIEFILNDALPPLQTEDEELREDIQELIDIYKNPQPLLNFLKKHSRFAESDETILVEIQEIIRNLLRAELAQLTKQPLSTLKNASRTVSMPSSGAPFEYDPIDLASDCCGLFPQFAVPTIWLKYPIGFPTAVKTFIQTSSLYQSFGLNSYTVLGQEYSQIDAIRGEHDNILIYLTPSLTPEMAKKLLTTLAGIDKRGLKALSGRLEHYFKNYHFTLPADPYAAISHMFTVIKQREYSWHNKSYHFQAIINLFLRIDLEKWRSEDAKLAEDLYKLIHKLQFDFKDKEFFPALILPTAELLNAIGCYYEQQVDFNRANDFYYQAYCYLRDKKIEGMCRKNQFEHFPPIFMGAQSSHSVSQNLAARELSSHIVILDNLIKISLRLRRNKSLINSYIDTLNKSIDELQAQPSFPILKITKREHVAELVAELPEKDPALNHISPMASLPRYTFFTKQVADNFTFDFDTFTTMTGINRSLIRHIKPASLKGITILTNNLSDAKKMEAALVNCLASGNSSKFGGLIKAAYSNDEQISNVKILFSAYDALLEKMRLHQLETETSRSLPSASPIK